MYSTLRTGNPFEEEKKPFSFSNFLFTVFIFKNLGRVYFYKSGQFYGQFTFLYRSILLQWLYREQFKLEEKFFFKNTVRIIGTQEKNFSDWSLHYNYYSWPGSGGGFNTVSCRPPLLPAQRTEWPPKPLGLKGLPPLLVALPARPPALLWDHLPVLHCH